MKNKDIIKFLDSQKTFDEVMGVLAKKSGHPITANGFIAGGAVSNILYSMLHGGEPTIRDIDVFHFNKPKQHGDYDGMFMDDGWVSPTNPDFPKAMETQLTTHGDGYGNRVVRPNGDFSIMMTHDRDGIFNNIKVHVGSRKENPNRELILLDSFDINACQSGIDMVTKKIIYTEGFVKFLNSKQLLIMTPVNPIQSVMRLERKQKDLECYCDFKKEFKLLQYSTLIRGTSKTFGEETYEKYLKSKKSIDKLFNVFETTPLFPKTDYDGKLWGFEPKIKKYKLKIKFSHPLTFLNYYRMTESNVSKSKKKKLGIVLDKIYKNGIEKLDSFHKLPGVYVRETKLYLEYANDSYKQFKKLDKKTITHRINHPIWGLVVSVKGYLDCDFDVKHIDFIEKFIGEHSELSNIFNDMTDINLQSHYRLLKDIKSISNKRGHWIIGELESLNSERKKELTTSIDKVRWISDYLDSVETELSKQLIEPLDLSDFEHNGCVKEITSTLELRSEGSKMGHCVGGYGSRIANGDTRIFHIDCDGIGSTLEVSLSFVRQDETYYPTKWDNKDKLSSDLTRLHKVNRILSNNNFRKGQHYGRYPEKGNLTPTDLNKKIAESLIDFLNKTKISKDYLKKLLFERYELECKIRKMVSEEKPINEHVDLDMWF